jgi:hypothetical protein
MAIQTAEIKLVKPANINDTTANGGRMSATDVADGVKNNIWPDVPQAERTAGSVKYRKLFIKIANDDDLALIDPKIFIETHTPGDDTIVMMAGTQTDTQAEADDYTRFYGTGDLDADISSGVSSIAVNVEPGNASAGDNVFQNGDLIRVSSQDGVDNPTGETEFLRLDASTGVSWNGDKATLTFDTGVTLANSYTAANTRVASVIEATNVEVSFDGWGESSASGTYDETTNPPVLDAVGSVEQTWTITFTDATNFTCVGDVLGTVGSGSIGGGDFAPNNTDFSKPYFTLADAGWAGTWANGDTVSFTSHPASSPVWLKRTVPAGANSLSGNKVIPAISGESS